MSCQPIQSIIAAIQQKNKKQEQDRLKSMIFFGVVDGNGTGYICMSDNHKTLCMVRSTREGRAIDDMGCGPEGGEAGRCGLRPFDDGTNSAI